MDEPTLNELECRKLFYGYMHQDITDLYSVGVDDKMVSTDNDPMFKCRSAVWKNQFTYKSLDEDLENYLLYGLDGE